MDVRGAVALVTGANRGIGRTFAQELLRRGASTVYAGARDPSSIVAAPGLIPVALDVTDAAQIAELAARLSDVTLVINNAGTGGGGSFLGADDLDGALQEMDVNYFGPLRVTRAFAPVLAAHGGGGLLNVLSALSFVSFPSAGSYSASKAAAWSLTNSLRTELTAQGTQVVGLHMGYVDTDMTAGVDAPKASTIEIVTAALDGLEAGAVEVLADDTARGWKAALPNDQELVYPSVRSLWAASVSA